MRPSTAGADHDAASPEAEDAPGDAGGWIVAGDVRLSPTLGEVWSGNRKVELSAPERETLRRLITSEGRGVTQDQISEAGQLDESDGPSAADAMEAQDGPKTRVRGGGNVVRKKNR
jgi:DNA-binding response OmpR family regulator